jgi:hypothetical protein
MRAPKGTKLVKVTHRGRVVSAAYSGGPYVELTFGSEGYHPTEVINVWNYETDQADPPLDRWDTMGGVVASAAVRQVVLDWIAENDREWPEWYEGYLENARY